MLTFAFMHPPYLVRILFGMPSLHLFTFLMFLSLVYVYISPKMYDIDLKFCQQIFTSVSVVYIPKC